MQVLPPALAPLGLYRQFITYKAVPLDNGKFNKIPSDWRTGRAGIDAHDPAYHTDFKTASETGQPVAFVLTDNDPFFCLDVDGCLQPDGTWGEHGLSFVNLFPGAACEVSMSGTGLHVWGTYSSIPPHGMKPKGLGLELYHNLRFIALGRPDSTGSAAMDCTAPLTSLIQASFPPGIDNDGSLELSDNPVADWIGPVDDDDLIRRACLSTSTASAFGNKASFLELWQGSVAALSDAFPCPPRADGIPFDASSADAALAAHLRFWTGADGERMVRLMLRSGLARDKYERDDYLPRTVLAAVGMGGQVCQDAPSAASVEAALIGQLHDEAAPLAIRPVEGSPFASPQDQMALFDGCVYITDINRMLTKKGQILDHDRFKSRYSGFIFNMDDENRKTIEDPWTCFMASRALRFPKVDSSCFRPDLPPREVIVNGLGRTRMNIYQPLNAPRKHGNPAPFLHLLETLLPVAQDREILLAYMAAVVQHKGVKFQWAPLIQGVEGNGKSTLNECVAEAIGREYCHFPRASLIAKQFNSWMYGKIFYGVDDIYLPESQRDIVEELKPLITRSTQELEFKGVDKATFEVCGNFILNCNDKGGLRKTRNDRRFAFFYTAQQEVSDLTRDGMNGSYFRNLYTWLKSEGFAIVTEFLNTYEIPEELNPALGWRAPETSSTVEALEQGLGKVEQEILERVERGEVGFAGGWVSSFALDALLDTLRASVPRNRRREIMHSLGYEWHPNLPEGRLNNPISDAGSTGRPRLFVKKGHLACNLMKGGDIARAYQQAQGDAAKHVEPAFAAG